MSISKTLLIAAMSLATATSAMAAQSSGSSSSSTTGDGWTVVEAYASGNAEASATAVGSSGIDSAYAFGDEYGNLFDFSSDIVIDYHVTIEWSYEAALAWEAAALAWEFGYYY